MATVNKATANAEAKQQAAETAAAATAAVEAAAKARAFEDTVLKTLNAAAAAIPQTQRDFGGTGLLPVLTDAWGAVFEFFTLTDARNFSRVCSEACGLVFST